MIIEKKFGGWPQFLLLNFFVIIYFGCTESSEQSERSRAIHLLTDDEYKEWIVESIYIDDVAQTISVCDSSYTLTLKSDFTWGELYLYFSCYKQNNGSWMLNDENNVITIQFIDQFNGQLFEKKFELLELSENYFTYQYVQNNAIKKLRMKEK